MDKKISELNALTGAQVASNDVLPIVDTDAAETKKITASELATAVTSALSLGTMSTQNADNVNIDGGSIDGTAIGANAASSGAFTTLSSNSTTTLNGTTIPASKTLVVTTDIGTTVQGYDADTTKNDVSNTFTQPQVFPAGTVSAPSITTTGDTNTGIYFPAADTIAFTEGGVEAMRIDSSGNVGVGTSSPGAKLEVQGNAQLVNSGTVYSKVRSSSSGAIAASLYQNANTGTTDPDGFFVGISGDTPYIYNYENSPLIIATNNTERMRIDSSGRVGIGVTSVGFPLDIADISGENLRLRGNASTGSSMLQFSSSNAGANYGRITSDPNSLAFWYGVSERARITSGGDLLVGTTSVIQGGRYSSSFDGSTANGIVLKTTFASTGTDFIRFVNSSDTAIGNITQNGATTVNYSTSSDYRLKHDIQPMTGALAKVATLKPVTYKWNADDSDGQGFIAHELQAVIPDAVTGEKDAVDAEGKPVYQGVDTSFLVATLTAAIQELKAELDTVKAELNTLKGA